MFKSIEKMLTTIITDGNNQMFISNSNDPIRQYCQTEFKKDWKEQYYKLTGRTIN